MMIVLVNFADFKTEILLVYLANLQTKVHKIRTAFHSIINWISFSSDETRTQLLLASLKSSKRREKRNRGSDC